MYKNVRCATFAGIAQDAPRYRQQERSRFPVLNTPDKGEDNEPNITATCPTGNDSPTEAVSCHVSGQNRV